ncbi:hypothetical protein GF324_03145 [bacterium]|nr:hypothetical protein [bacterium]
MRVLFVLVLLIAGLMVGLTIAGSRLPKQHEATVTVEFAASPDTIWALLSNHTYEPLWRPDLEGIELIREDDAGEVWEERYRNRQVMQMRTVKRDSSKMVLKRELVGSNEGYSGSWTTYIDPLPDGGTKVTMTERGTINSPLFRGVMKYLFGTDSTIRGYLSMLAAHLGEEPKALQ